MTNLISAGKIAAECSKGSGYATAVAVTADDVARIAKELGIQPDMRIDFHPLWTIESATTITVAVLKEFLPEPPEGCVLLVGVDIRAE